MTKSPVLHLLDITQDLPRYTRQITNFIDQLQSEKQYFDLLPDAVLSARAHTIVAAFVNENLAGIAYLERKKLILRNFVIVKDNFQRMGLGKQLLQQLHARAKDTSHIILALINAKNAPSLKLHTSLGYRIAGKRWNDIYYLFYPLTPVGSIFCYVITKLIPVAFRIEKLRR